MTGSPQKVHIAAVVTADYLFDFLILYESLALSWSFHPFVLHAFVLEDQVGERIAATGRENIAVHRLPGAPGEWSANAAQRIELVEHAGLERCIVTDADNVFLAETPEIFFMLAEHELVFFAAPAPSGPVQTSLWGFRRTERTLEFAHTWRARAGEGAAQGPLLAELLEDTPAEPLVLCPGGAPRPSPYGLDSDLPTLALWPDTLGFREERAGRIRVLHLAGLRGRGNGTLAERIEVVVAQFPRLAPVLPLYAWLAKRAAVRLGIDAALNPVQYVNERLLEAGLVAKRHELPELFNRRGLLGTGVEVGVQKGVFSEALLRAWQGRTLISVDSWLEAGSNASQAQHDRFYEETVARLAPFGERSAIWRTTSAKAAARIEPHTLDFVYVDARHDYRSVMADLGHWFEKIRPGGIFAGHDYIPNIRSKDSIGVKPAVDEFFAARGLRVKPTYDDSRCPSWVVEIPAPED
jgi:Methyltransferase domain